MLVLKENTALILTFLNEFVLLQSLTLQIIDPMVAHPQPFLSMTVRTAALFSPTTAAKSNANESICF